MRLGLTGGGTGGHVYPLIAIALRAIQLGIATEVLFLGTKAGLEGDLVSAAGFQIETLMGRKVRGGGLGQKMAGMAGLVGAIPQGMGVWGKFRPDVVVGSGGYASVAGVTAAWLKGIPTVLLEQNTIPGYTNRKLAFAAQKVCVSFPVSAGYFPAGKVVVTGNPVRPEIQEVAQRRKEKTASGGIQILVLGGSQGALFLNQEIALAMLNLVGSDARIRVVHQCGKGRTKELPEAYLSHPGVRVKEYIEDMASELTATDLVVGRAGATTIAELTTAGVPSLLIPFPFAADNHQEHNALAVQKHGGAEMWLQSEWDRVKFEDRVRHLLGTPGELEAMSRGALTLGMADAATAILTTIGGMQ